jgi:hypothetical protein
MIRTLLISLGKGVREEGVHKKARKINLKITSEKMAFEFIWLLRWQIKKNFEVIRIEMTTFLAW